MEGCLSRKEERDLIFQPNLARIERILPQIAHHRLFQLRFIEEDVTQAFSPVPGQFIELTVPGVGEAPISISSPPTRPGIIEICVRKAGLVTSALFEIGDGTPSVSSLRGPR
jgi:sulfhydrogenase subunit gamma (sulfur reductase)